MIIEVVLFILFLCAFAYYLFVSPSSQVFGRVNYRFDSVGKQIALTFDDGPNEPYTSQLLDVLKKYDIKATFFVCGACVTRHPQTLRRIYSEGHEIGNHSHDHRLFHYLNQKKYIAEVENTNEIIKNVTGTTTYLYRSPWLFRTRRLLKNIRSRNLLPVWGIFGSELEVLQPSPESMARRALKLSKPGTILIFHDGKESVGGNRANTVSAIKLLIPALKEQGFEFIALKQTVFK